jgi:hypothetical protein
VEATFLILYLTKLVRFVTLFPHLKIMEKSDKECPSSKRDEREKELCCYLLRESME